MKICKGCNKEFTPKNKDQVFCTNACFHSWRRRKISEEEINALYLGGKSTIEIAKLLSISISAANRRIRNLRSRSESAKLALKLGKRHPPGLGLLGPKNARWKGGIKRNKNGYISVRMPNHPRAPKSGFVAEHTLVWEKYHGPLPEGYVVHHLNGVKSDNRSENLVALPIRIHAQGHKQTTMFIKELRQRIKSLEEELQYYKTLDVIPLERQNAETLKN